MITTGNKVPELNTKTIEPLDTLEKKLLANEAKIKAWFEAEWKKTIPPIYGSIDLRNAGFKLAPIDMNLFPAGFNNLNPNHLAISVQAAKKIIKQYQAEAERILILPESHTRNTFYWDNIKSLRHILTEAGFEVRIGMLDADVAKQMKELPLKRKDDHLFIDGFTPDVILLNNDLSDGIPETLQNLNHQLIPPAELGWSQRLKSGHFQYYAEVAAEFAEALDFDSWLIAPLFRHCGEIDFMQQGGIDCLVIHAEALFNAVKEKYEQYKIPYQPFLVIKADAGTYGMAVMTVRSPEELRNLNRKQRTNMSTIKGGKPVKRVIIQEGVYTFETLGVERAVAEPVVYLFGDTVVGGFYRVHTARGTDENLNAPGMKFEPLAFTASCNEPCPDKNLREGQNRFYMYGVVAMLSMLAAARELKG